MVFLYRAAPVETVHYLEYIQSSGTQYFNTGVKPNQDTKIELKVSYLDEVGQNIAGVRNSTSDSTNRFGIITFGSSSQFGAFFRDYSIQSTTVDQNAHVFVLDKSGLYVDETKYGSQNNGSFSCQYDIVLFGWNNGSGGISTTKSRVYYCNIYSGESLVKSFRPCLDESNTSCMYESVEKTYSYGTGTFIAGPSL